MNARESESRCDCDSSCKHCDGVTASMSVRCEYLYGLQM